MADDPDNHTLILLQEMRAEIRDMRHDLTARLDTNTLILNMLTGLLLNRADRIEKIEAGP